MVAISRDRLASSACETQCGHARGAVVQGGCAGADDDEWNDRALALQKLGRFAACLQPMARSEFAVLCKNELGVNRTVLQQVAMQSLHSQTQPLTAKEEWKTVLDLFGDAWFMSMDGKSITKLNERFWAGLVKQQLDVLEFEGFHRLIADVQIGQLPAHRGEGVERGTGNLSVGFTCRQAGRLMGDTLMMRLPSCS